MQIATRQKIRVARLANRVVRMFVRDPVVSVRRGGLNWCLAIDEGIDFAIFLTGSFEPSTRRAYSRLIGEGSVVIDIGANMGAHTLHFAKLVAPTGCVLAFEPTASAVARLRRNISVNPDLAPRVSIYQAMIASEDTAAPPGEIYSSWPLVEETASHPLHLGVPVSTAGANAISLNKAVAKAGLKKISLIKLDVDGFEMDVLRGADAVLRKYRPVIVMEIAPYVLEERGESRYGPVDLLEQAGYRFASLSGRSIGDIRKRVRSLAPGHSINILALPD